MLPDHRLTVLSEIKIKLQSKNAKAASAKQKHTQNSQTDRNKVNKKA